MALLTVCQATFSNTRETVVGTEAPGNPYKGLSWTDTGSDPPVTKVWDGARWVDSVAEAVGGIEVGGRNLLPETKAFTGLKGGVSAIQTETYNGLTVRYLDTTSLATTSYTALAEWGGIYPEKLGAVYTFSFYAKGTGTVTCYFYGATGYLRCARAESSQGIVGTGTDGNVYITLSEEWERYWVRWTLKDTGDISIEKYVLFRLYGGNEAYVCGAKLELGNTATNWTPAPEDTETYADNLAADLQTQIDGKIQTYNQTADPSTAWTTTALQTQHTGDIWYNPDAKETKRWSGTAWGKLENKEAEEASELAKKKAQVFTEIPTVPYYVGDLWFNSVTSDIMTCVTARTTGSYTASDWAKRNKYTDDSFAQQVQDNLDNLQIGGRNLSINTRKMFDGNYSGKIGGTISNIQVLEDASTPSGYAVSYDYGAYTASQTGIYFRYSILLKTLEKLEEGEIYTVSFWAKASREAEFTSQQSWAESQNIISSSEKTINTEWKKYYATFQWTATTKMTSCFYISNAEEITTLYLSSYKLEKGNTATDWTPAPEDFQSEIDATNAIVSTHTENLATHDARITANQTAIDLRVTASEYEAYKTTVNGELTSAKSRLSTAESSITALQGEIALKVEQTDIDTAVTTVKQYTDTSVAGKKDSIYHKCTSSEGTAGYFHVARCVVKSAYANQPVTMTIANRAKQNSSMTLIFANANSRDPSVYKFQKTGDANFYIYKSAESTWDLYVQKAESYDSLAVTDFSMGSYSSKFTWTWYDETVTAAISGWIAATQLAAMYGVDATSGGVSGSNSLITSGAVYQTKTDITSAYKAAIEVAKDSITQAVSETYATETEVTTVSGNVTSLTTRMTAAESKLTKDSLVTTIGSYYATLEDIDIGGRNLLRGTREFTIDSARSAGWSNNGAWTFAADDEGFVIASKSQTGQTSNNIPSLYGSKFATQMGDTLVFSCWFMVDDVDAWDGVRAPYIFEVYDFSGTRVQYQDVAVTLTNTNRPSVESGKWVHFYSTHTVIAEAAVTASMRVTLFRNGSIHVKKCKIELGTIATDWSPSPEDDLAYIAEVETIAKQTATEISWLVKSGTSSTNFTLTDRTATLIANAINLSGLVTFSGLDSAAQNKITTAQSTADTAVTNAAAAQTTADTAKTNAATAQSTANTANARATYNYGTCGTAAATAAKVVTCSSFPTLYTGATIWVKFTYANTVASPTLNVNSTGAKAIYAYGAALTASSAYNWVAGATVQFIYNGTQWELADSAGLNKANSALTKANTANTNAATAQSAAAAAQTTADTAVTNAATAQTTADKAATNAATAQTTADKAVTSAAAAQSAAATAQTTADTAVTDAAAAQTMANTANTRATYHYGTCATAAATAAKAVTLSRFALYTGATVSVKFTYANTAASPTLNVNNTGAKAIYVYGAALASASPYNWVAGATVQFVYNGTQWVMTDTSAMRAMANWCYDNDISCINGANIYAGTVTAKQIDVEDLFAQDITATGTIRGVTLEGVKGAIGGFEIMGNLLQSSPNSEGEYTKFNSSGAQFCHIDSTGTERLALTDIAGGLINLAYPTKIAEDTQIVISQRSITGLEYDGSDWQITFALHASTGDITANGDIELYGSAIDFHYDGSSDNYTSRIIDTGTYLQVLGKPLSGKSGVYWGDYRCICSTNNTVSAISYKATTSTKYMEFTTTAGAFGVDCWSSDRRLKENIADSGISGLDVVNAIRHRSFDWADGSGTVTMGYVAQELQEIEPGLVFTVPQPGSDDEGLLQISASSLLPYVTKAVQELSGGQDMCAAGIESLRGQLAEAQAQIAWQAAEIAWLKSRLEAVT